MQNSDVFTDLAEIDTRYKQLAGENANLTSRHLSSEGEMDKIMAAMEQYKKDAGIQSLSYTNKIAEEQAVLQHIEAEKAALMIGNEENTEQLLKQTSEHGIILMSIKSLF